MKKIVALLIGTALLGACGIREPLSPPPGHTMPVAPALATRAATPDELLALTPEQRPLRVDEPLTRSTQRQVDRFSLPPPDVDAETRGAVDDGTPQPTDAPAAPPQD